MAYQLNHLNLKLVKTIAPTDSRFRPDQRGLEYGLIDLATSEKLRLEEKQRSKRKINEKNNVTHKPKWFVQKVDPLTNYKEYCYLGGYWEAKNSDTFDETIDIF